MATVTTTTDSANSPSDSFSNLDSNSNTYPRGDVERIILFKSGLYKFAKDNDVPRILGCLKGLNRVDVTVQHLQDTGIGRVVNSLRREPGIVGKTARDLVGKWKDMVLAEENAGDEESVNEPSSTMDNDDSVYEEQNITVSSTGDNECTEGGENHPTDGFCTHDQDLACTNQNIPIFDTARENKYSDREEINRAGDDIRTKRDNEYVQGQQNLPANNDTRSCRYIDTKQQYSENINDPQSTNYCSLGTAQNNKTSSNIKDEEMFFNNLVNSPDTEPKYYPKDNFHSLSGPSSMHMGFEDFNLLTDSYSEISTSSTYGNYSGEKQNPMKSKDDQGQRTNLSRIAPIGDSYLINRPNDCTDLDWMTDKSFSPSISSHAQSSKDKKSHSKSSDKLKNKSHKSDHLDTKTSHKDDKLSDKYKISKRDESSLHHVDSKGKETGKCRSSSSKTKGKHTSSSDKHKSSDVTSSGKISGSSSSRHSSKSRSDKKSSDSKTSDSSNKSKHKVVSSNSEKYKTSHSDKKSIKDSTSRKRKSSSIEHEDDGIDCQSGASFAEALGMLIPSKPKKKPPVKEAQPMFSAKLQAQKEALPTFNAKLDANDPAPLLLRAHKLPPLPDLKVMALPDMKVMALPDISPIYKPRPPPPPVHLKPLSNLNEEEATNALMSTKNMRTKVYSGNKTMSEIPTLYKLCVQVLQEHIDALEYTGGVPYEILKPIVDKANPEQLFILEHYNPYLMEDTNQLWKSFCEKHFRNQKRKEMETWKEMYLRCREEQEYRLKSLTAHIKTAQDAKNAPVKQTKMAYVDSVVKPPRNIARQQAIHGTARAAVASPAARVVGLSHSPNVVRAGTVRPQPTPGSSTSSSKPKKAPLMQKALQFMRGRQR